MDTLKESEQKVLLDKYYSMGLNKKQALERLEVISAYIMPNLRGELHSIEQLKLSREQLRWKN